MAAIAYTTPKFRGTENENIDIFVANYLGHLATLGIDPAGDDGPPTHHDRAFGVLRSCMEDEALAWFDDELSGKNWELSSINNVNNATLDAITALNCGIGAGGVNAGTYVAGSNAGVFANNNGAVTFGEAFLPDKDTLRDNNMNVTGRILANRAYYLLVSYWCRIIHTSSAGICQ